MRSDSMNAMELNGEGCTPPHAAMEQAAEWFALLSSGAATPQERAAWRAWLDQHPDHSGAWRYVERVSQRFAPLHASDASRTAAQALQRTRALRQPRRRILAALAVFGILGITVRRVPVLRDTVAGLASDYRNPVGAPRLITLADGTQVWLNSGSAIDVDYGATLRRLILTAGEILVETGGDSRPLVVDTPQGRMRALGTRFTVRRDGAETLLAVYSGAVEIRLDAGGQLQVVGAGRQTRFSGSAIASEAPADPAREAWTRGILLARDISLDELLAELGRYRLGHLSLDPAVAGLRVSGGFPLRDTDHALALLANALPIEIRRPLPWWVSIGPRL
ncbi:FecR domain-containing protein [Achromobacter anxifer]